MDEKNSLTYQASEWSVWPIRPMPSLPPAAMDGSELVALEREWLDAPERPILPPVLSNTAQERAERVAVRAQRDVPRLLAEVRRLRAKLDHIRYAAGE